MDFLLAKLQSGSPKIVPLWSGWNLVQTSLQNKNIECWNRQVLRTCFKHIFSRPTPPESSQFMGKVRHFLGHQTSLGISFSQKRSGDTKLQMAQRSSCSPDPPLTRSGFSWYFAISLRVDQPLKGLEKMDEDQGPSCQGVCFFHCFLFPGDHKVSVMLNLLKIVNHLLRVQGMLFFSGDWLRNLHHSKSSSHGWEASPAKYLFCHWICQTQTMERSGIINTTAIGNRGT